MKKLISLLLIVLMLSSCARQQKSIHDSSAANSDETRIGSAIHQQIIQTSKIYEEPALNEYVQAVGTKLASNEDCRKLAYRFIVLEDNRIYAIHAPGGYVYITTGFFKFLQNEIELAGILSHEIAMLQYRDPKLSKFKKAFELVIRTGTQVGPAFGTIGALSALGLVLVGHYTLSEKDLSKRLIEADEKSLQYMVDGGYDPQGLLDPLNRINDPNSMYRAYLYDYIQSHPMSVIRQNRLNEAFQDLDLSNKQFDAARDNFLSKTKMVRELTVQK